MISFSIDKQRGKVNVEWMSRPVDSLKNKTKNQPLVLVLTSTEQSPTFASRLKRKLLSGPILGGAYKWSNGVHHLLKELKSETPKFTALGLGFFLEFPQNRNVERR